MNFWPKSHIFPTAFLKKVQENTANARKTAQKVLKVHFSYRKSILRTKVDLATSWDEVKTLKSASTKQLPLNIFH